MPEMQEAVHPDPQRVRAAIACVLVWVAEHLYRLHRRLMQHAINIRFK